MFFNGDDNIAKDFLKFRGIIFNRPDLESLARLLREFIKFPYENLTKIIKASTVTDIDKRLRYPAEVLDDHITFNAGGTCYSLTYFFKNILDRCGFDSYPVLADRSYGENTHCALIVKVDNKRYLADPGYCLEHPIEIPEDGKTQFRLPNNRIEIVRNGHYERRVNKPILDVITEQGGKRQVRYHLKDVAISEDEFKHWWRESFNWPMMRSLCITKNTEEGYIFVRNNHIRHNTLEKRYQLNISKNIESAIASEFNIDRRLVSNARECVREVRKQYLLDRNRINADKHG